jgi:hypothetical protein
MKSIILISLFLLLINLHFYPNILIFAQGGGNSAVKTNVWISKQNNLNITMNLQPNMPVIDQWANILFEVKKLNGSGFIDNLNARVTITDHDGRLFKFVSQPVSKGKFSVEYMFPDDGQHRVLLQLYKNGSAFAISSFDIVIPHPLPPPYSPSPIDFLFDLFKNLF